MKIKKKTIGIIVGGLIGIILIVGVVGNMNKGKAETFVGPKEGQLVKVGKVEKKDIQTKVSSSGILYADVSEVLFAESNNKVVIINKKAGDAVKKGDVILTLDKDVKDKTLKEIEKTKLNLETAKIGLAQISSASKEDILNAQSVLAETDKAKNDIKESIRSTKASLNTATVDEKTVIKEYELSKQLFTEGLTSQEDLDNKKKAMDLAKENIVSLKNKVASLGEQDKNLDIKKETADYNLNVLLNTVSDQKKAQTIAIKQNEIKSLELQIEMLADELEKSTDTLVAPIDGVVAEVLVEEGSSITSGQQLVRVIQPNKLIVKSEVAPFYAAQLKEGLLATIKYNGSQTIELEGKISKVAPTAITKVGPNNVNTTAIPVEIDIVQDSEGLKPGLVVDVRIITTDVKGVVAVPLLATMEDKQGKTYVFVVKDDFTLEKRFIEQGVADNQYAEIKGLKEGEVIITNPTESLNEETIVKYEALEEATKKEDGKKEDKKEDVKKEGADS